MPQAVDFDLKQLVLSNAPFGPQVVQRLMDAISADFGNYRLLREAVQELETDDTSSPAAAVRLGVCYHLLGRYRLATEMLSAADGGALAQFYLAKSHFSRQQYDDAIRAYEAAKKAGYDRDACVLGQAEALAPGRRQRGACPLGSAFRRRRADGRVSLSAGRHRRRPGRQSARGRRSS